MNAEISLGYIFFYSTKPPFWSVICRVLHGSCTGLTKIFVSALNVMGFAIGAFTLFL